MLFLQKLNRQLKKYKLVCLSKTTFNNKLIWQKFFINGRWSKC